MYTVVSAVPFEITEKKAGQVPPEYVIPSAEEDIQVLHINDATYGIYLDADRGTLPQTIPSNEVARGLIEDFVSAQHEYQSGSAMPALFAVPGHLTRDEVKAKHSDLIKRYKTLQLVWFRRLISSADDDWKRWGVHRVISDPQRAAAKALGLKKDWMITAEEMMSCPACAQTIRSDVAVCPQCRCIIDKKRAEGLSFAKAV